MLPEARPPADTTLEAWAAQIEVLRRLGGARRCEVAFRLTALARETARSGIRVRHAGYSEDEVRRAFFRMLHGDEVTRRVWPQAALVDP